MNKNKAGEHTQGKWTVEENVDHIPFIMAEDNNLIAKFAETDNSQFYGRTIEEQRANAQRIVTAVNSYDDMLEALKTLKKDILHAERNGVTTEGLNAMFQTAREAITNATKG
jgi:hypothetical protein